MEKLGTATRNAILAALATTFYGAGNMKLYTGSQPATADTSPTGTLIVTITLPASPFAAPASGSSAKQNSWSGVAVADADLGGADAPGWFRIETSGNTNPVDGEIGAVGSGKELELDSLVISIGQTVNVNSGTMSIPAS